MIGGINLGKVKMSAMKHSPEIAVALGIIGFVGTVIAAVKATPKALAKMEEARRQKAQEAESVEEENVKLTVPEKIKAAGPCYILPLITGTASIACIIFSNRMQAGRIAGLTSTCGFLSQTLNTYQDKVKEVVGEKKEKKIREEIAKDKIASNPVPLSMMQNNQTGQLYPSSGLYPCMLADTGDYFWGNEQTVADAFRELERRFTDEGGYEEWIPKNDLRVMFGLRENEDGEILGWNAADLIGGRIAWNFGSSNMPDGTPVFVVYYRTSTENYEGVEGGNPVSSR